MPTVSSGHLATVGPTPPEVQADPISPRAVVAWLKADVSIERIAELIGATGDSHTIRRRILQIAQDDSFWIAIADDLPDLLHSHVAKAKRLWWIDGDSQKAQLRRLRRCVRTFYVIKTALDDLAVILEGCS